MVHYLVTIYIFKVNYSYNFSQADNSVKHIKTAIIAFHVITKIHFC
jgi:hypothetical protein